jgi:outer membrane lipase/esterase
MRPKLQTLFRWLLSAALLGPFLSVDAAAFSKLYILGDSLSDSGNVSTIYGIGVATGAISVPENPPAVPSANYFPGTFSNGPNYSVTMAAALGLQVKPSVLGGTNYAYGAARTDYHALQDRSPLFLGLTQQRDLLLASHPSGLDGDALYVVFGGSNNVQDLLSGARSDGNTGLGAPSTVAETVLDLKGIVGDLFANGAQSVMVVNLPDLGLVPGVSALGPLGVGAASFFSAQINAGIAGMVAEQKAMGRNVIGFDLDGLFDDLVQNAAANGFTNTTGACFTGDDVTFFPGGTVCDNPDEHIFWDSLHPSARVHAILGAQMAAPVPEPGTWALMGVGVLVITVARRRAVA